MNRDDLKIGEVYFYRGLHGYLTPVYYQAEIPGGIGRRRMVFMDLCCNKMIKRTAKDFYEHRADCPKYLNDLHDCECSLSKKVLKEGFEVLLKSE